MNMIWMCLESDFTTGASNVRATVTNMTTGITTTAVVVLAWQLALLVLVCVNVYIDAFTRDGQHKPLTTHHKHMNILQITCAVYDIGNI